MNKHILSVKVDDLAFNPLPRGISDIDPFTNFHFSAVHFEGDYTLHEIGIKTLDELIDGVFILCESFQRLFLFESEAIDSFLQLSVFFGFVVLSTVVVGLVDFCAFE